MRIAEEILELLYPSRCAFCHRLSQRGERVCKSCAASLPYTYGGGQQSFAHIEKCVSPLYYEGDVRQSLLRYKFHGLTAYAEIYGKLMLKSIDECGIFCDIITWVPLSRKRRRRRGYDQAQLLAEQISRAGGTLCRGLLIKLRDNPAQSGTGSAAKRRANVAGVYSVAEPELVRGRRVLIVDDIVTTGATLTECARALKAAGAAEIFAVTAARKRN